MTMFHSAGNPSAAQIHYSPSIQSNSLMCKVVQINHFCCWVLDVHAALSPDGLLMVRIVPKHKIK